MKQIIVTIGRNVGKCPMSTHDWETFKRDVVTVLESASKDNWVEIHTGTGKWDGVFEESAKISVLFEGCMNVNLTWELRKLAAKYHQDAIALVIGDSVLVPAAGAVA